MATFTLYGDFTCPATYLAFRRAALLAAADVRIEFGAVEQWPVIAGQPDPRPEPSVLQGQLAELSELLLEGEQLPAQVVAAIPVTRAAVTAYAEAVGADVGWQVATRLFQAFWVGEADISQPDFLRSRFVDIFRHSRTDSEILSRWGHAVGRAGEAVTSRGWQLQQEWAQRVAELNAPELPILLVDEELLVGTAAINRLGEELTRLELPFTQPLVGMMSSVQLRELPSKNWTTMFGGRWLRRRQVAEKLTQAS